jgi:hypothetical protein
MAGIPRHLLAGLKGWPGRTPTPNRRAGRLSASCTDRLVTTSLHPRGPQPDRQPSHPTPPGTAPSGRNPRPTRLRATLLLAEPADLGGATELAETEIRPRRLGDLVVRGLPMNRRRDHSK